MRFLKRKFPKLKQPTLCQFALYSPVFLFFAIPFLNVLFAQYYGVAVGLLLFFAGAALALWFLIGNAPLLIMSDLIFSSIRYWKKARTVYFTEQNGRDLMTAEKNILRRMRGKDVAPVEGCLRPTAFRYRRYRPLTVMHFAVEKMTLLYTVDVLTEDIFREILSSAKINAKKARVPRSEISTFLMEFKRRKAGIACGVGVVILTQRSEFALTKQSLQPSSGKFGCIVPCVAVLDEGAYYLDPMPEAYMHGMREKPEKNFALDVLRHTVFGGTYPLKDNERYLPFPVEEMTPETTLWQLVRMYRGIMDESDRAERAIAKKLRHGEVLWDNGAVFCKLQKRMARFETKKKGDCVEIFVDDLWSFPSVRRISEKDQEELRRRMETYFVTNGYRCTFILSFN